MDNLEEASACNQQSFFNENGAGTGTVGAGAGTGAAKQKTKTLENNISQDVNIGATCSSYPSSHDLNSILENSCINNHQDAPSNTSTSNLSGQVRKRNDNTNNDIIDNNGAAISAAAAPYLVWSKTTPEYSSDNDKLHFRTGRWNSFETVYVEFLIQ